MSASIVLLSGGASRRMGQDKALLPIQGTSLLEWQEQSYQRAGFNVISRLTDVFDGYRGPLAGIHAACEHHPEVSAFIVIPVDMPQLSLAAINRLLKTGEREQSPVCFADCPLPIYLPNTPTLKNTLQSWLADENGKRSVYALMKQLNGHWLAADEFSNVLTNINTPEQWQAYQTGAQAS